MQCGRASAEQNIIFKKYALSKYGAVAFSALA